MRNTQARPPPNVATSHEARQANTITAVLWYQSAKDKLAELNVEKDIVFTSKEFVFKFALYPCLVIC